MGTDQYQCFVCILIWMFNFLVNQSLFSHHWVLDIFSIDPSYVYWMNVILTWWFIFVLFSTFLGWVIFLFSFVNWLHEAITYSWLEPGSSKNIHLMKKVQTHTLWKIICILQEKITQKYFLNDCNAVTISSDTSTVVAVYLTDINT